MIRLFAVLTISVAFVGCGEKEQESRVVDQDQLSAMSFNSEQDPTVEFSVPDMMCPDGCGVAVKEILAKQPGAKDVFVDFEGKIAKVAIEKGKFDQDKALAALIDRQFTNSSLKGGSVTESAVAETAPVQ